MPRYATAVAHELGKAEALARLRAVAAQARTVSDLDGDWQADSFAFSVTVQGLRIAGRLTVEEDRLAFDGTLPLIAMPFRNWIPRVLRKSLEQRAGQTSAEEPAAAAPAVAPLTAAEAAAPAVLFLHIPKAGG